MRALINPQHEIDKELNDPKSYRNSNQSDPQPLEDLFTVIAHDLRDPISSIKMLSGFIRDELLKKNHAEVTSLMNLLHTQVEQTEHLLNELLAWGKSRTQQIIVHRGPVSLTNVFNELVTLYSVRIQEKAIVLETQVSPNLVLFADHYLLQAILRNLLTNAIKFSFRNGKITLNGYSHAGEVIIQVQDEGQGIEPAILDKLLGGESYITTPGTHNESGSGLGLLICKEYVRLHGGTIRIDSPRGKGTRITLSFPGP